MTSRRAFLAGLLATGAIPARGWADAGNPSFLAAARKHDGRFTLFGLGARAERRFSIPLPGRGHAAAAHPLRAEAVVFARRPGRFALVIDCISGSSTALLEAPDGRHFYGHGTFSADGSRLYTTENDYDNGMGRIGIWDAAAGYRRVTEWLSAGVGPHDVARLSGPELLVVANGGIATHPDSGRTKLNIPDMRSNLAYLDQEGTVVELLELDPAHQRNSIRHLAVSDDGLVAFGMQWQGSSYAPPLLGLHRPGESALLLRAPYREHHGMAGYVGSAAFSGSQRQVGITSPRGGRVQFFDARTGAFRGAIREPDASGIAALGEGFAVSAGTGRLLAVPNAGGACIASKHPVQWDNHLVRL